MANRLIYIPNDYTQNYFFCRLQLVVETFGHSTYEPTNQNSMKVPKVVETTNKITLLKTLDTRVKRAQCPFPPRC